MSVHSTSVSFCLPAFFTIIFSPSSRSESFYLLSFFQNQLRDIIARRCAMQFPAKKTLLSPTPRVHADYFPLPGKSVRIDVRYVITKFSGMDSLPNFLTHGAPLRARFRARELSYKTNRFHVAVGLFSNRSQRTSKCGKNNSDTLACDSCATSLFLRHFDVICDLLLNRRTATWNLFVKYNVSCHVITYVMSCYITCVMSRYITCVMLSYITYVMLCYITCDMTHVI